MLRNKDIDEVIWGVKANLLTGAGERSADTMGSCQGRGDAPGQDRCADVTLVQGDELLGATITRQGVAVTQCERQENIRLCPKYENSCEIWVTCGGVVMPWRGIDVDLVYLQLHQIHIDEDHRLETARNGLPLGRRYLSLGLPIRH